MDDKKITVTLDEVNNSNVDAELHRQNVAERMAEHQEKIRVNFETSSPIKTQGGFFRNPLVYMSAFGAGFSFIAWMLSECVMTNVNNATSQNEALGLYWFWYITFTATIGLGLSIADGIVSHNPSVAIKNGILGLIFGGIGGALAIFITEPIYHALGGGGKTYGFQQFFARGIAWGFLGAFVAIAPGIIMKSGKKFLLGLAGGAIGGFIGGILFDPICYIFNSDVPARFVNIIGLGVGAAVATVFLENIAKQGWLKVAAGLIAGKQFILYRNPTVIGSSPKCEIYLFKDSQITAKHAAINNHNGEFIITSIEGAPIYLNNVLVKQQRLKTGDQVKIGSTIFIFEAKAINNK